MHSIARMNRSNLGTDVLSQFHLIGASIGEWAFPAPQSTPDHGAVVGIRTARGEAIGEFYSPVAFFSFSHSVRFHDEVIIWKSHNGRSRI